MSQLDLQSAAQQALDQHERLRETVGDQALVAAAVAGEQRAQAMLDANRVADITSQLDADYLARTLGRAQELLSDDAVAGVQAIIREA